MLQQTLEFYYCGKVQVIPIRSFHFIMLIIRTHCDKLIAIYDPPYYVVGAIYYYVYSSENYFGLYVCSQNL